MTGQCPDRRKGMGEHALVGGKVAFPAGAAEAVPTSFSAADREPLPLVSCRLPQLGSPRPLRGELPTRRPRAVKDAQEAGGPCGGALVLALTARGRLGGLAGEAAASFPLASC